jgi:MFS superfamily sulfate permease-like transporter
VGAATAAALELPVKLVEIPNNILGTLSFSHLFDFSFSTQTLALVIPALSLAFIASAESLLCAAAGDQMSKRPRTQYNKEL